MPWQEKDLMSLRKEFVLQATQERANLSELCRRYKISRKTGYKWIDRFIQGGIHNLKDLSKKPHQSPSQLSEDSVERILIIREKYPYWGARKIRVILAKEGIKNLPTKSVIHKVLQKNGCIKEENRSNRHFQRFEHEAPNHLWQMDFKGHFAYEKGRCYPLTILDDHSRFSIRLQACTNERGETVKPLLIDTFRRYGLPNRINVDNGNPWGSLFDCARYTTLSIWLIRLGISVSYSRPGHPQTNGKDERFHRTLKLELLNSHYFKDLNQIQEEFDAWRTIYNLERPHEGIGMEVPANRYHASYRAYPEFLPSIEYTDDCQVRKVDARGRIHWEGRQIFVGRPFNKEILGIRYRHDSETIEIYYCHQKLGSVCLKATHRRTMTNLYSGRVTDL